MVTRVPRVRETLDIEGETVLLIREGLSIAYYVRAPHEEIASAVWRAFERYRKAIEPRQFDAYLDIYTGDRPRLDAEGEAVLRSRIVEPVFGAAEVHELYHSATGICFKYEGRGTTAPNFHDTYPENTCCLEFRLPTEFLEERGPEWIRALAIDLGRELPWNSGHAGLSLEVHAWIQAHTPRLQEVIRRHPGFDLVHRLNRLALYLGTKLRPPAWLTFLGPPVLNELGGAAGLRSRLHSPSTQVEALSPDRAVVSLGPVPEAGDLETGDTLPAYRELARVLEPWLYVHKGEWGGLTEAEVRQWERRFL
ncbi:type VI immunity family protein [Corallococcus exercitus]|uniref:type VI immunity family protein n=1 Tax=Corallococcus exercitus TaxID=2316736 RepID=UPI0035D45178